MTITLPVTKRDAATSTDTLRTSGQVPAVVYGPKQEPIDIAVEAGVFDKVRKEAGESTIVNLEGLDESIEVLIKGIDFSPVKQGVMHIDFYAIERGKDMTVSVALEYVGEAPVEENKIGTVNKVMQDIEVSCRPSKLPAHIEVDLSQLETEISQILVSDLPVLEGVVYNADATEVVAVVSVAKEEVEEDVEAPDMDAIEVEQKGKDEEVGAESASD